MVPAKVPLGFFTKECAWYSYSMIIAMRWPLFWRPQVDEPLYDIRIVSWQVWNFSFFFTTSGRSKILDLQKETLMWHSNFRFHAQLLGDCGQLTSKDEGPTAVVIRCVLLSEKKKIGHVRWELSMIVSATSRSPARKRTLGYEKNEKNQVCSFAMWVFPKIGVPPNHPF